MKVKRRKKTFAEKAYKMTKVDAEYTQMKIEEMLEQLGIDSMRITKQGGDYVVEFIVNLYHGQAPRKVRLNVPISDGDDEMSRKHLKDAIFRVLFYNLKNRFVTVTNGLKEFDSEFAMDIVMIINGKEQTLSEIVVPEIKRQLEKSPIVELRLGQKYGDDKGV